MTVLFYIQWLNCVYLIKSQNIKAHLNIIGFEPMM